MKTIYQAPIAETHPETVADFINEQNKYILNTKWEEGYDAAVVEHHISAVKLAGNHCEIHKEHRPMPMETEVHHIWPLGMGGPDRAENKVKICPTSHSTIHVFIRHLAHGIALPPSGFHREKELAKQGFETWLAAGKPGHAP